MLQHIPSSTGRMSRRRFIGRLALAGGAALLAACGNGAPAPGTATPAPTATAAPSPTAPIPATTPSPAGVGATAARASGTATRETVTPGGTRTPASPPTGDNGLLRALALVPQAPPLPGANGIAFADVLAQKRNYGLEGATSTAAFGALGVDTARVNNTLGALPLPDAAGFRYARDPLWRDTLGYDFWQIEQAVSAGAPPGTWTRLAGRFEGPAIEAALARAGHRPVAYGGATLLARGEDGQIVDLGAPLARLTLAALNRVVLRDGALEASPTTALARAGIDAAAGRVPTFAADPDHAALAAALWPVVGAWLLPPDPFFRPSGGARGGPATATAGPARTATPGVATLHPYRLAGFGLRDDGTVHTMLVALAYERPEDARADAPLLRQRASDYRLLATRQLLRERAPAGEPAIVAAGARTVVVLPFAVAQEAHLRLWQEMLTQRDYGFLAE